MRQPVQFGKYLLLDRIAVGGMAEVFAAKAFGAEGFERILAIKKILPTMGEDPDLVSMFVDEARIAVQLSHPNIVQVLELGKHDETLYIAMEYISGRDLRQLLDRYRRRGQPLPIPHACAIAAQVCEALDYAHRKRDASGNALGIVHRDVSPQNVLVSFDGGVKLIDFGIAKAERRLQETQSGILKGKFSYMSPEQVRGDALDHRSDVFAAGVLLWELICGRKLFTGDSDFALLEKVRKAEVPPPAGVNPEVPDALSRVVLAALAPEPRDRYQWCSDLHDDLLPFAQLAGAPLGSRQLAAFVREELRAEHDKEQARLQRWVGLAEPDRTSPDVAREWRVAPDGDTLVRPPTPNARTRSDIGVERTRASESDSGVERTRASESDSGAERTRASETPTIEVDGALLAEQLGATQATRVLGPGEGAAPGFDSSGELTAARRTERRGPLTRPRRGRVGSRRRLLGVAVAAGVLALAGVAYLGVRRGSVPGKVIVTVRPAVSAELTVDGRSSGPLPPFLRLLPPGRHRIEVQAAGYKPFSTTVELGRRPVEVEAALAREEPPADEQPGGAEPTARAEANARAEQPARTEPPARAEQPARTKPIAAFPPEQRGTRRGSQRRLGHEGERRLLASNAPMAIDPAPGARPARDGATPARNRATPARDEATPAWDGAAPARDGATPAWDGAAPARDGATPAWDGATRASGAGVQPSVGVAMPAGAEREPRLHVISEPIGAEIRLAGRSIGRAPLTTDLLQPDRDYDLSATLEGYVSVRRVVRTSSGVTDVTLALPLQPIAGAAPAVARAEAQAETASALLGYLVTNTRPAARVSIDGRQTGRWTPVPEANPIALPAGAHTILFETADGKRHEETLQIEPGKTFSLVRDLRP